MSTTPSRSRTVPILITVGITAVLAISAGAIWLSLDPRDNEQPVSDSAVEPPSPPKRDLPPQSATVEGELPQSIAGWEGEQLVNAAIIMKAGFDNDELSDRDVTIGIMTAMGESSLQVLDHGDDAGPDSRGLFQQRDSFPEEFRLDAYASAYLFFSSLAEVYDRDELEPTIAAHRVQFNADPQHYAQYWEDAVKVFDGLKKASGDYTVTISLSPAAAAVINR